MSVSGVETVARTVTTLSPTNTFSPTETPIERAMLKSFVRFAVLRCQGDSASQVPFGNRDKWPEFSDCGLSSVTPREDVLAGTRQLVKYGDSSCLTSGPHPVSTSQPRSSSSARHGARDTHGPSRAPSAHQGRCPPAAAAAQSASQRADIDYVLAAGRQERQQTLAMRRCVDRAPGGHYRRGPHDRDDPAAGRG